MNKKMKIYMIIGLSLLLMLVVSATYAYFQITSSNNATSTTTTGTSESVGNTTLTTNVSSLYLNLSALAMSEENIGTKYYATTDTAGTPITNPTLGNGIYTLATASASDGDATFNCNYSYDISATLTNPITDGSDEDIKVTIKGSSITGGVQVYTLKQLITGTQTLNGTFNNLGSAEAQTITIESTVENTADRQNDFAGNSFTLTITPKAGNTGFSCSIVGSNPQYEQLVNYTYYDFKSKGSNWIETGGHFEFTDNGLYQPLGGTLGTLKNGDWNEKKLTIPINMPKEGFAVWLGTKLTSVNYSELGHIIAYFNSNSNNVFRISRSDGWGANVSQDISVDIESNDLIGINPATSLNGLFKKIIAYYDNGILYGCLDGNCNNMTYTISSNINYMEVNFGGINSILEIIIPYIVLFNHDDWQLLCEKAGITAPVDISTLLANQTSLTTIFNNRDAVNYMARQCTGDFMASAVQSTTFKTALEASAYKDIIESNEHWAKFLAMST